MVLFVRSARQVLLVSLGYGFMHKSIMNRSYACCRDFRLGYKTIFLTLLRAYLWLFSFGAFLYFNNICMLQAVDVFRHRQIAESHSSEQNQAQYFSVLAISQSSRAGYRGSCASAETVTAKTKKSDAYSCESLSSEFKFRTCCGSRKGEVKY